MAINNIRQKETHAYILEEVSFDTSWFEAMHKRGFTPADLPNLRERHAYAEYLQGLKVIAQLNN